MVSRLRNNTEGAMKTTLVASAFKFLNEVAFFLLAVIVPVLVGVGYFSGSNIGEINTIHPVWLVVWLVV